MPEREGRKLLAQLSPVAPDPEVGFADVHIVNRTTAWGLSFRRQLSKSCRTAS